MMGRSSFDIWLLAAAVALKIAAADHSRGGCGFSSVGIHSNPLRHLIHFTKPLALELDMPQIRSAMIRFPHDRRRGLNVCGAFILGSHGDLMTDEKPKEKHDCS